MIIFTHRTKKPKSLPAGFTLPEVMIATTLSVFTLAGILSAFLLIGRTALGASNYSKMETEIRHALNLFADDARNASDVHWTSPQSITLIMPDGTLPTQVTYSYLSLPSSALGSFCRQANDGSNLQKLVDNISNDFAFQRFKLEPANGSENTATNDLETKQIQLTLRALSLSTGSPSATQTAISTRYVLRNKNVSQ